MCQVGGKLYFIRAMTVEGLAIQLAWLDDVLPGRDERKMPPSPRSEEAQAAMASPTGRAVMVWIALREHGLTFEEVNRMPFNDLEYLSVLRVLYDTRRTREDKPIDDGDDISRTWCGEGLAHLVRDMGMAEVCKLSLDQFEWLMSGGDVDSSNSPANQGFAEAVRLFDEAVERDRLAEEQEANG